MRTFEEITADIARAKLIRDSATLQTLAHELRSLGTSEASAAASQVDGVVCTITGRYAEALEYYRQALRAYDDLDDHAGIARVTADMGIAYWYTGDYQQALEHYRRALHVDEMSGNRLNAARITGNIGAVYANIGDYPQALENYRRALQMHEELGDRASAARVINNIGAVYANTGDYPQALEHYRRALQVNEELSNRNGAAQVTGNIGNVYLSTGDYPQALEHFRQALQIHEEHGFRSGVANVTANIGGVYASMNDYPKALEHYRRALQVHEELGEREAATNVRINMAATLIDLNRDEEAEELLQKQSSMNIDSLANKAFYHATRARLAENKSDMATALEHLQQALSIVTEIGEKESALLYHKMARDLARKRGDFDSYVEHNDSYISITEEIKGKETTQRLAMIEAERQMETERREREKEQALLYGALPESVATRMLRGEDVSGDHYENVSVLFLDIAGFTTISDRIPPGHVVHLLKAIFKVCDEVCKTHGLTKIKTIGDSYLAVGGVPENLDDHIQHTAQAAVDMLKRLNALELTMDPKLGDTSWTKEIGDINVRIGLHCGPLVAGIVGEERLQYDVWGDTVNVASRMESTGEPGRIHVSEAFATALDSRLRGNDGGVDPGLRRGDDGGPDSLTLLKRGEISIKGKGPMTTYWLEGA